MEGVVEVVNRTGDKRTKVGKAQQIAISPKGVIEGPVPIELHSIKRWWEKELW